MPSVMDRSGFPDLMEAKGYWAGMVTEKMRDVPEENYMKLFREVKSTKKKEKFTEIVGLDVMSQIAEYADNPLDNFIQGYDTELESLPYGKRMIISREAWDDDQYGVFKDYAGRFVRSYRETKAILGCTVLNNAFTSTGPDGQFLIDTDHPREDGGGNISNKLATNAQLTISSLQQLITQMRYIQDGRGKYLFIKPKYLVVGTSLEFKAEQMLKKGKMPFTSDNTENIVGNLGLQLIVLPWLTSSTAWFLVGDSTGKVSHPIVFINRIPFETDLDYIFVKNKGIDLRAYFRAIFGIIGWRGIAGSSGA